MMRRLNLVFLAVLLAVVAVFGGGMHLVHGIQVRAERVGLAGPCSPRRGRQRPGKSRAIAGPVPESPARGWTRLGVVRPGRGSAGLGSAGGGDRVFLVHEQALRYNPGDLKLERRCADLALELERYNDAQRHLTNLLEKVPKDSRGQPATADWRAGGPAGSM